MPIPCNHALPGLPRLNDRRLISLPVLTTHLTKYSLNKTVQRLSIKRWPLSMVNSCLCYVFVVFYLHAGRGKVNKDAGISYCGGVKPDDMAHPAEIKIKMPD